MFHQAAESLSLCLLPEDNEPREFPPLLDFVVRVFPGYQVARLHRAIAAALEVFLADVEAEKSPRLMITVPPRHGKSELASALFPAYVLGKHPDWPIIHTSYTAELSNDFSRKVQALLAEPAYRALFPGVEPARNSRATKRWGIQGRRGFFVSTGVGGPITGRGAKVLIIDDPIKNRQDADSAVIRKTQRDWYGSTALTRLEKGAGVLLIQTRWHIADLGGYVTTGAEAEAPPADAHLWRVLNLPALAEENDPLGRAPGEALWPEKFDRAALDLLRGTLPARDWLALYQQRPVNVEGNFLEVGKIAHRILTLDELAALTKYQAWDLAISEKASADYTACVTWGIDAEKNAYLLDVYRRRMNFFETMKAMGEQAEIWKPKSIGIETTGYQAVAFQEATAKFMLPFREVKPEKDKATRAQLLSARVSAGKVFVNKQSPWWREFEEEARAFPTGTNDDQIDAAVYGLFLAAGGKWWQDDELMEWLRQRTQGPQPAETPKADVQGSGLLAHMKASLTPS